MSKSGSSAQIGAPSPVGFGWTRQRRRGTAWTAESMRARRRSKSGARSKIVIAPNVDAKNGSFSTRHIKRLGVAHLAVRNGHLGCRRFVVSHQPSLPRVGAAASAEVDSPQHSPGSQPENRPGRHPGDDVGRMMNAHVGPRHGDGGRPSPTTAAPGAGHPSRSARWRRTPPSWHGRTGTTTSSAGARGIVRRPTRSGRVRRNRRLMPWLTIRLSVPTRAANTGICLGVPTPDAPRTTLVRCQMTLNSPSLLADVNTASASGLPRIRSSWSSPHFVEAGDDPGVAVTPGRARRRAAPRWRLVPRRRRKPGTTAGRRTPRTAPWDAA